MALSKRNICLWILLSLVLIWTTVAGRSSIRRMHRRSESLIGNSRRYQHSAALRRFARHQRSTYKVMMKRYSTREDEYEAHMRLIQAQRLRTLQLLGDSNGKPWWGQWSSWSACGRTCGSGVQFQQRHCLGSRNVATQKRGKILCSGSTRNYRICSTEPCSLSSPSFRKLQCSQLASKPVRGRYYSWKPYGHPDDEIVSSEPCQLVCISLTNEVQTSKKALDGTECRKGWNHGRCVNGKCQFIGCDGKINSTKLRDKCGNCGENNRVSCTVFDRDFTYNFEQPGEVEVVRIPKDSYDILILGKRRFASDIVLKYSNGTTLFNCGSGSGNVEREPRNVVIAGVEFRYRQPGNSIFSSSITYLLTIGPIKQEIMLHVARRAPGVASLHYEFKVPIKQQESTSMPETGWNDLDSADAASTRPTSHLVVPTISIVSAAPTITSLVRKVVVPPEITQDNDLEREDGESFLYIREFEPVDISRADTLLDSNVTDDDHSLDRENEQLTFTKPKSNVTLVEDFISDTDSTVNGNGIAAVESGETIVFQGDGKKPLGTRESVLGRTNSGGGVNIIEAGRASPPGSERPNNEPLSYSWRSTGFAPCSSTCSEGLQDSYTRCEKAQTHEVVDDRFCDPITRPEPVRKSCKSRPCEPRWEATPWSECSKSCGLGQKSRTVRCWKMISAGFDSTIYNELCANVSGEKPSEVQPCKVRDQCGPLWETSDWSTCHAPCDGFGTKQRLVRCSAGNDDICTPSLKPHGQERCRGKRCLMKWIASDWGECNGACGGGRIMRKVLCFDNDGRRHPDLSCDPTRKPETSHPCGDRNCHPEWITQEWDECSAECGEGIKKRVVLCSGIINGAVHHYNDSTPCNATSKPAKTSPCQAKECDPVWLSTPWSQCSVTCGSGRRVRQVNCYRDGSPALGCNTSIKPIQSEPCHGPPCPKSTAGVCKDQRPVNCKLVTRVNLCPHWYYQKACCESCRALRRGE